MTFEIPVNKSQENDKTSLGKFFTTAAIEYFQKLRFIEESLRSVK